MSAASAVRECMKEIPSALAVGLIDLSYGTLISVEFAQRHPEEIVDFLAPATKQVFDGHLSHTVEKHLSQTQGSNETFQEILIASKHVWHYFGRVADDPSVALAVIAGIDVRIGLLLVKARAVRKTVSIWT